MSRVLIAATNTASFDRIDRATGLWLGEAVHFQDVMEKAGIQVDYVSPLGGYVPIDPASVASDSMDEVQWGYYRDLGFLQRCLGGSMKPEDVDPSKYDAIYFAGGHGVMWDFPECEPLGRIAEKIYANGGIVSSVCHGYAALLTMKNEDGTPFVSGRKLTGFSNDEEAANGTTDAVPFLVQTAVEKQGADYTSGAMFTDFVVEDGRLVTGQNPMSARSVGEAVLKQLQAK